jgi:hypothetical protein
MSRVQCSHIATFTNSLGHLLTASLENSDDDDELMMMTTSIGFGKLLQGILKFQPWRTKVIMN